MLPEGRLFSACFLADLITSAAALPAGSGTGNSGTTGSGTTGSGNALPVDIPEGQSLSPSGVLTVERIPVLVRMLHLGRRDVYSYNYR